MTRTAVVIVTYNSEKVLGSCLKALSEQTMLPEQICIVDSGSTDTAYLATAAGMNRVTVLEQRQNIGFSKANNIGFAHVQEHVDYILFLNPDTLLDKAFIAQASEIMEKVSTLGIVTGQMLGYDFLLQHSTGRIDSTGVFRKWYGRWYDRGHGRKNTNQYMNAEDIPAACGALMFCRKTVLNQVALPGSNVFDPDFFLYKEDIELSFRLRKAGWRIRYYPELSAFHGRGWGEDRRSISRDFRKMAARNEILLYKKYPSPYMLWAFVKYVLVAVLNV